MFHRLTPTANRVLMMLAVFTFACWALAAAAVLTWGPGHAVALKTVSRIAERIAVGRAIHSVHPRFSTISALRLASTNDYTYGFSDDDSDPDFSWSLQDGEGTLTDSQERHRFHSKGEPTFWFRDQDVEYVVTDPALVAEVQRATEPMRELGRQMGELGSEMGMHGAAMGRMGGRMGAMGARLAILESRMARRSISRSARSSMEQSSREMRDELQRLQAEFSTEQGKHARRQRELSQRMSELSARHNVALRKAKAEVREIARKA